jgi:tetrapyrrole methylase family protein / MazG family protein
MKTLVIAGLGPGGPGQLTAEARALLEEAQVGGRLLLRTRVHPVVQDWPVLRDAPSLDHLYERSADFGEVYDRIARAVLEAVGALPEGSAVGPELVYAVPGHPALGEATVPRLRRLAREAGIAVRLVPGLSFVDAVTAVLGGEAGAGEEGGEVGADAADLRVADALALGRIDPTVPLLVCQVYSRRVAAGVKLALGAHYPDEHPVVLVRAAGVPGQETVSRRPLYEIDRDGFPDHLTSLWVPPLAPLQARREPETLRLVMARLRAPDGCPWDREQTHASLRKYLLEETYEALEALDAGDTAALEEELGDLLLQIVFHAQIADEAGDFDLGDVVAGIVAKLIRRHPHVFGGEEAKDAEAVLRNWEALKRKERAERAAGASQDGEGAPERSMLDGVPRAMPALAYAQAVQDRAARVGFDWPDVAGVVDKVAEEARELAEAPPEGRQAELGDLLFSVVNLARRLGIDAEEALRGANGKFLARFASMEGAARRAGKTLEEYDPAGLDALWEEAKSRVSRLKSQVSRPAPGPAGP